MDNLKVGTCGYGYYNPPEGWKEEYETKLQAFTHDYNLLEVNRTFYKLPQVKTCKKWRDRARKNFTFTLKAWQAITHPISSPTWRNRDKLTKQQRNEFGYLRPNDSVKKAWKQTVRRAKVLEAPVILLQTPPSFDCQDKHEENLREFLSSVPRSNLDLAWEMRGDWMDNIKRVHTICSEMNLIPVEDPLQNFSGSSPHDVVYFRLHGLNEPLHDYDYDYSKDELETLAGHLWELSTEHKTIYCLFNNHQKFKNVKTLLELIEE